MISTCQWMAAWMATWQRFPTKFSSSATAGSIFLGPLSANAKPTQRGVVESRRVKVFFFILILLTANLISTSSEIYTIMSCPFPIFCPVLSHPTLSCFPLFVKICHCISRCTPMQSGGCHSQNQAYVVHGNSSCHLSVFYFQLWTVGPFRILWTAVDSVTRHAFPTKCTLSVMRDSTSWVLQSASAKRTEPGAEPELLAEVTPKPRSKIIGPEQWHNVCLRHLFPLSKNG